MRFFTASRLNKMKTCFRNGDYEKALVLADKISPTEIRTAYDLSMMADIYMAAKRYGAARRVFAEMYKRNKTVRVCKQLITLNIKLKSVKQAIIYLKELNALDNEDYERFIYQYQIGKMLGQPDEYLIECLKKVREADYIDKWALELAKLFYKSGRTKECIKECQNIKLWFPDTEFSYSADLLLSACRAGASYEDMVERSKKVAAREQATSEEFYEEHSESYDESAEFDEDAGHDEITDYDENEVYDLDEDAAFSKDNDSNEPKEDVYYDAGYNGDKTDESDYMAENTEFESYPERSSVEQEDESITLLERSAEGKEYGSGTFDDRSYVMRRYDSAAMTEISAGDEAEISVAAEDVTAVPVMADEFETDVASDLSGLVMTIMEEDSEKNSSELEKDRENIAATLVNDSLTSEVINALFEQEKNGIVGERDAVDESILKMLEEDN